MKPTLTQRIIGRIKHFVWEIPLNQLSPHKSFVIRQIRIFAISGKGFAENNVQLRATALTLYSLLSIVPILAVGFGIAKGFGFEEKLNDQIRTMFAADNQKAVLEWAIQFANNMLKNASGGIIAGIGIALLFWSVIKVMGNIESSMNYIWQIRKPRSFFRKVSDYISIILFSPLVILISSGVTVFIEAAVEEMAVLSYLTSFFLYVLPYLLVWLSFTLVYIIMPNTKVFFRSALLGGIIAGSVFQVVQWGYINFQHLLSSYGAIYGSFAALPLFIIWLQLSWQILLFGALVAYADQNVEKFEFESESLRVSHDYRRVLSLLIVHRVVNRFVEGEKALSSGEIARQLSMPVRIVRDILFDLTECGIFTELAADNENERGYQPAIDTKKITMGFVIERLEKHGLNTLPVAPLKELKRITELNDRLWRDIDDSPANKLLRDI